MLDIWIIERLKRREEDERRQQAELELELPLAPPDGHGEADVEETSNEGKPGRGDCERGVTIVDFSL